MTMTMATGDDDKDDGEGVTARQDTTTTTMATGDDDNDDATA